MKRPLVFIATLLIVFPAIAGDVTLSWNAPTQTEACTNAGPLTNLAGYRIYQLVATVDDPDITEFTIPGQKPGTYEYVASAFDEDGDASRLSGRATKEVETFDTVGGPAYTVIKRDNRFVLLPVGTVDAGQSCDVDQSVNGRHAVDVAAVTWTGTVRPVVVVADCQ